jgi:hypothetical protein
MGRVARSETVKGRRTVSTEGWNDEGSMQGYDNRNEGLTTILRFVLNDTVIPVCKVQLCTIEH